MQWYSAESVTLWRYSRQNVRNQLSLVVLHEPYEEPLADDEFLTAAIDRYRVLKFDEAGNYIQVIWTDTGGKFTPSEPITPFMNGKPLNFIPFFTCPGSNPEKSMLYDLAIENIGHYQKVADHEEGLHMTSIATPIVIGAEEPINEKTGERVKVHVGGTKVWFLPNTGEGNVDAKYMEFSGAGMEQLLAAIKSCEERMAILGARIISVEKKGVETAEAARIHRAGENSVLAAFARNMSEKITLAVRLMAEWNGVPKEICDHWSYQLNTDYDEQRSNGAQLSTILQGVESGMIPMISLYNALRDNEFLPETMSFDEFMEERQKYIAMIPVTPEEKEAETGEAEK
jgi:hypothetical protein